MFRASSCPSSGAHQLQQQHLVYRRNVVVAVLLVVVGPAGRRTDLQTLKKGSSLLLQQAVQAETANM